MKKTFSIVLPIYGNEKNLPITIPYLIDHLYLFEKYNVEIIMVCDGSPDDSWEIMKNYQRKYPDLIRIAKLTRNFGQGAAIRCGMKLAKGDVAGTISADMQDPIELFSEMLKKWEEGNKFVIASRSSRDERGVVATLSRLFNKLRNKYISSRFPKGGFDCYIVDRTIINTFFEQNFNYPFGQSQLIWLGYDYAEIEYVRKNRSVGKSGYRFWGKVELAFKAFFMHSDIFLNIMFIAGILMFIIGMLTSIVDVIILGLGIVNLNIVMDIFFILCIFCGIIQISLAVVGKYVWYTMEYTKNNMSYVIDEVIEK